MSSVLGVLRALSAHARDAAISAVRWFAPISSVSPSDSHMALVGSTFAKKVRGGLPPLHTAAHRSTA